MNPRPFLFAAIAATTFNLAGAASIDHDKVPPFPQPESVTVSEKTAVKFKPSLEIVNTCHPYPAVNAAGETSGGLKGRGGRDSACKGSGLGSQVYGRAGFRHKWASAIVWLDNSALDKPKILAVSTSPKPGGGYWYGNLDNAPPVCGRYGCSPPFTAYFNGTSPMIVYEANKADESSLSMSVMRGGELQDLIMWEQLTEEARDALSTADFGERTRAPFIDAYFNENLESARQFL